MNNTTLKRYVKKLEGFQAKDPKSDFFKNLPGMIKYLNKLVELPFYYKYPRPALTVDAVVFGLDEEGLKILLIQRRDEPFKDMWALPGGFLDVDQDDTAEDAVARELQEETALENIFLEQLYTFSKVGRDPRERVVSVAYYGLVKPDLLKPVAGDDAKEVEWSPVDDLPELAFDHKDIVEMGLARIRGKVRYQPIGFELLPEKFTLVQLQEMYEFILGRPLDKRNFRRKILQMEILVPLEEYADRGSTGGPRPQLYSFDEKQYHLMVESGFNFEV